MSYEGIEKYHNIEIIFYVTTGYKSMKGSTQLLKYIQGSVMHIYIYIYILREFLQYILEILV